MIHGRAVLPLVAALLLAACGSDARYDAPVVEVPGGDAAAGRVALTTYGCARCHTVPGVRGTRRMMGPSLARWAQRPAVAGRAPNDPETLIRFLVDPQSVAPGTSMPNLSVSVEDARDMAAYLFTLR
jgi:cytochrome c